MDACDWLSPVRIHDGRNEAYCQRLLALPRDWASEGCDGLQAADTQNKARRMFAPSFNSFKPRHHFVMSNPLVMMNNTLALRPRGIRQAEVPPAIAGPSFKAPCHFYARGACQKGANCRFSHERATASAGETASEQSQEIAQKDSRAEIPCHFFAKGGCRSGDDCPFLHEQNDDGQNLAIAPPATTTSQEQSLDADKVWCQKQGPAFGAPANESLCRPRPQKMTGRVASRAVSPSSATAPAWSKSRCRRTTRRCG